MSSQLLVVSSQDKPARPRRERVSLNPKPYTLNPKVNPQSGFTLLELVVVVAVLVVLILAVVLVLRPVEMSSRARDAARMADLEAISAAIGHADANGPSVESGGFDPDGSNTNTCLGESSQTVYVSVPNSETPPSDLPLGWTYGQVLAADLQNVNGSGWLPINFTAGGGTSPISALPIDASNKFSSGFYYSYVCNSNGSFELNARMVSEDKRTAGQNDVQSDDGGDDRFAYEAGSDLTLNPRAPIGYWGLDEGTGTSTIDSSRNSNDGTLTGNTLPTWQNEASCVLGACLDFTGTTASNSRVDAGEGITLEPLGPFSAVHWLYIRSVPATEGRATLSKYDYNGGGIAQRGWNMGAPWTFDQYTFNLYDSAGNLTNAASPSNFFVDNINTWTYVVGTFEPSTALRLYADGLEIASDTTSVATSVGYEPSGDAFSIGRRSVQPQSEFDGLIDEVLLYDRTLTAEEVAYQYEALKP